VRRFSGESDTNPVSPVLIHKRLESQISDGREHENDVIVKKVARKGHIVVHAELDHVFLGV
jgi:hypothetical protein